jgi:hypothetical protein
LILGVGLLLNIYKAHMLIQDLKGLRAEDIISSL